MPNIALDDIISVQVTAAAAATVREGYNVGLIVGQTVCIPQSVRCVEFDNLQEMADYGFAADAPEYQAAALYFGQQAVPSKVVVAKMAPSTVAQSITPTATGVTSPQVTESKFVAAVGDRDGEYLFTYDGTATAWKLNGKVVSMTDYGISWTGSPSNGNTIKVVFVSGATGETWQAAIADCRDKNQSWYGVYCACPVSVGVATRLTSTEQTNIAAYVNTIKAMYFFDDYSDADKSDATTDVFSLLTIAGTERWTGIYSGTLFAGAAVMGYALGANTGAANSAYTMAYKRLNGVEVTDLTVGEINNLKGKGANYYILRGGSYKTFEPGQSGAGRTWIDEVIGVDQLTNDLQRACMDVLTTVTKVPYTDAGVLQFVVACNAVCDESVRVGFLAPGIWNGNTVLNVNNGDTLEAGYSVQAESVAAQSAQTKADRVCPPIYVCAILAGAIHSVVIKLDIE